MIDCMIPQTTHATHPLVIRKSNKLIEARYHLSIWEQRLILTLLINISKYDEDFKRYRIRISDFAAQWQLESDNSLYQKVHEAADSLVGRTLQISDDPTLSKTVSWLSYVEYVRGSGVVEMEFHSALKPYLIQLKRHYTEYEFEHVVSFKNQYTIRIYELLKMEVFKYRAAGEFSKKFKYEDLRILLAISNSEYTLFGHFKSRIIDPSIDEISAHTDLDITKVRYGKEGRKVVDITFVVTIRTAEQLPILPIKIEEGSREQPHPIIEHLISLGFAVETARKYKLRFGVKRIERNIAYTKAKQESGMVKDFPAFLNQAIKEDMGSAWEMVQTKQEQDKAQKETQAAEREARAAKKHLKMLEELAAQTSTQPKKA